MHRLARPALAFCLRLCSVWRSPHSSLRPACLRQTVHFILANADAKPGWLDPFTGGKQQRQLAERCANWHKEAQVLSEIMALWGAEQRGILLIDEVDMLLNPLRSELNFPLGDQAKPLDLSPLRWDLPLMLLDVIIEKANGVAEELKAEAAAGRARSQDLVALADAPMGDVLELASLTEA